MSPSDVSLPPLDHSSAAPGGEGTHPCDVRGRFQEGRLDFPPPTRLLPREKGIVAMKRCLKDTLLY